MILNKNDKKFVFLVIIVIVFLSIALTIKTFQNDTFYTIKIGENILKYGVDMKEHFSWIPNLSYTYPHWLYNVIVFLIYDFSGFTGLYIFTIILTACLGITMFFTSRNITKNSSISFGLTVAILLTLKDFITARAQLLSYILLLLILFCIEKLRETGKKRYIIFIFVLSLVTANIHAGIWPFIFILFLPYMVGDIIGYFWHKNKERIDRYYRKRNLCGSHIEIDEPKNFKKILTCFFLTVFTGFLTPNSMVPFTWLINTKMGNTMAHINEHLATTIEIRPALFVIAGLIFFLLLLANMKIKLTDLFMFFGLLLLAFLSRRSYALFAILNIFTFVRLLDMFTSKRDKNGDGNTVYILTSKIMPFIIIIFFTTIAFIFLITDKKNSYVDNKNYPVEASDYIISNLDVSNIRLYNEYDYGSYLIFREIPVFIDSRADLYTPQFNKGCTVFNDFININSRYKEIFLKYGITHAIIKKNTDFYRIISHDDNIEIIYEDLYFVIYEIKR